MQDKLIEAVRESRLSDEQCSQLETILVAASNLDSAVDPEAEWHEERCRVPVWAIEALTAALWGDTDLHKRITERFEDAPWDESEGKSASGAYQRAYVSAYAHDHAKTPTVNCALCPRVEERETSRPRERRP